MADLFFHLTHTDIRLDSRILKELRCLTELQGAVLHGVGVELLNGPPPDLRDLRADVETISLFTNRFDFLPRPVRYALNFFELTPKFVIRGFKLKASVVHCHDTLVLPAGVLIKLGTGCKLVYDAHELESNKSGQSRLLSLATLFIERICWRWVDLLVSVSDSILDWYRGYFGPKESVLVLNSPEIDAWNDTRSETGDSGRYFHELYDIQKDKLVFLYLGVLGAGRGIEIALEAFASSLHDAHLVLVGYGNLSSQIRSYCDRHNNIHLHKPVPHDRVVALAASADVGLCLVENVSLSDYYCLPNKLFEYCFAGLLILGSDFPEIRKVVNEYALGTCCAPDPDKVRDAIQFLIDHRPTRTKTDLSALGWNVQAERLLRAYRRLLASRGDVKLTQDGPLPK